MSPQSDTGSAIATRIAASADSWKRKLLDLTKRNRALNFKVNKVSTITVVDEQPAEVFRQLCVRGLSMKFKARSDSEQPPRLESESREVAVDASGEIEEEAPAHDFAPYDSTSLGERHTDDWLQTTSTPDALDRSLRRLDEQARLSVEEQGVVTLFLALGMLHYRESADSDVTLRAPLVLLPVELTRKSARTGYAVRATEDEALVNPALAELLRRDHAIAMPVLPEGEALNEQYDLQRFMEALAASVATKAGWAVKTEIVLGLFSFQKFVMYKDLEENSDALKAHRLIRQLVTRAADDAMQARGLPEDVRIMDLDRDYPPESTFQVVDADSSQLRAIAASARNYDLVIEGPPGTGKSQTITNLIAQALSVGKSVLFVAEKMAALSVVHDRLVRAKLGEFCLELHSTKANKRAVMKELGAAMDASLQSVAAPTASTQRLPQVRATLTEYANAVHLPYGVLGISPYRAYGELGRVMSAPRLRYEGRADHDVTLAQLEQTVRDLGDLAIASDGIGVPAVHAWRDTSRTFYTEDALETVRDLAVDLASRIETVTARAAAVRDAFNLPPVDTFADVDTAAAIAEVVSRSPGAPLAVLENDAWNRPPADAGALIDRGRTLDTLKARAARSLSGDALEQDHASDVAFVEQKSQGTFSFLAFLDGRYRAVKKRWIGYRLPSYQASLIEQANEMKHIDRLRAERQAIAGMESKGRELFGGLWDGEQSNWDVLDNYVRWVVEFRGVCVRHRLTGRALEVAAKSTPDVSAVAALRAAAGEARVALDALSTAVGWPQGYLVDAPLRETNSRARAIAEQIRLAPAWAAFESARQVAAESLASELLPIAMGGDVPFRDLAPAFLRAFYLKWLSTVVQERPVLQRFHTRTHDERMREFRELDERVLMENRAALVGTLRDRVQHTLRQPDAAAQMPYLRRELARQRGLSPLRRTIREAGTAVRAVKPCFMMSPLTVAQLLDGSAPPFELIIFDEASQLPAEDAVGSIIRGKQLVVVGDPKQLPPTNFFSVSSGMSVAVLDDDGQPLVEDSESILEEFMGAGVPMSRLKWHYRSAHESLISFSNVQFYESDLYTFPSVETGNDTFGLQFEYVADGVYEGKGLNAAEARRVAAEVVRFAKEQLERRSLGEPTQSLGVGTFNLRQQLAILDELEQRRRDDPSIEPFFDRGSAEPFFVKNLENIQGDERDVIFISVTYAKATDGRLRMNFGPLNGDNGWRRLNVLTTRARQRMKVFSSMRGDEINSAATTSRGALLLREFLLFAERGKLESVSASLAADTESPFEQDVLRELTDRGIHVVPQVGVAGYRIDLGVLDDVVPGKFLLGIECDGVAYHSSETARDRDRLRQQVLEARGWVICRVWSTDWFKDRPGQIERLLSVIADAKERARQEVADEQQARARAAVESARRAAEAAEAAHREAAELAATGASLGAYLRPVATPYALTPGDGRYQGDILAAPAGQIVQAVVAVVEHESPIHEADVFTRVASQWSTRAGSRIQARIRDALFSAVQGQVIQLRGEFCWSPRRSCVPRSRAGTRIPADRIAPEEYQETVLMVLGSGHGFSRSQLTAEVRSVLGFTRTGEVLDEAISQAVESLIARGSIGEASVGIRIRR